MITSVNPTLLKLKFHAGKIDFISVSTYIFNGFVWDIFLIQIETWQSQVCNQQAHLFYCYEIVIYL